MSDSAQIDKLMSERKKNADRFFKKYPDSESIQTLAKKVLNYVSEDSGDEDDNYDNPNDPELTLD